MDISDSLSEQEGEKILNQVIQIFLIPNFERLGMNATGEWKKNVEARGFEIWGRDYTPSLQYGREPGKYVPIQPLKQWAMAKFGYDEKRALGMAFAVSNTIKKEGTSWYKKGGSDILSILQSPQVTDYINQQIGKVIQERVRIDFQKEITKVFR